MIWKKCIIFLVLSIGLSSSQILPDKDRPENPPPINPNDKDIQVRTTVGKPCGFRGCPPDKDIRVRAILGKSKPCGFRGCPDPQDEPIFKRMAPDVDNHGNLQFPPWKPPPYHPTDNQDARRHFTQFLNMLKEYMKKNPERINLKVPNADQKEATDNGDADKKTDDNAKDDGGKKVGDGANDDGEKKVDDDKNDVGATNADDVKNDDGKAKGHDNNNDGT